MKFAIRSTLFHHLQWLCLALFAAGCTGPGDSGAEQVAVQKANAIYQAIQAKDFQKAASLFSKRFYQSTSPEKWTAHLEDLHKEFGDLKSYDLKKVITNSNFNGVDLTLKYKAHYAKHDAFEQMIFATEPSGGTLEIMDYKVELDKFES